MISLAVFIFETVRSIVSIYLNRFKSNPNMFKGSPTTKASTCIKVYLLKQKRHFVKEINSFDYIVA